MRQVQESWLLGLFISRVLSLITALACQVWTRPVPHSLKAAVFSIGALTSTPYMLAYDLAALSVPTAFLVADSLAHGFRPGERFVLTACFLALFLCFNFAVGPIVLLALMGLVVKRVRHATNIDHDSRPRCPIVSAADRTLDTWPYRRAPKFVLHQIAELVASKSSNKCRNDQPKFLALRNRSAVGEELWCRGRDLNPHVVAHGGF